MNLWDQQPDEPPEAYARFLIYRNLGPARTLTAAERLHGGTGKRKKTIAGHWCDESARFGWVRRAVAWDVANLQAQGAQVAAIWADAIVSAIQKVHATLTDPKRKPRNFDSAMVALEKLAKYVNADALDRALNPIPEPPPAVAAGPAPLALTRADVA